MADVSGGQKRPNLVRMGKRAGLKNGARNSSMLVSAK